MEPLSRASIIIARHHLSETDLVAVAVPWLSIVVLIVTLARRFFVLGGSGSLLNQRQALLSPFNACGIGVPRRPGSLLSGFREGGGHRSGILRGSTFCSWS